MTTTDHAPSSANNRPLPGASDADDLLPPPAVRKGLRKVQGLTQEQAAALLGVSDGSISNWEQRGPGTRNLPRYLTVLLEWANAARAAGYHVAWPAAPAQRQE